MRVYDSLGHSHDYCEECFPTEEEARQLYYHESLEDPNQGGFLWDSKGLDTPPYGFGEGYTCCECGKELGEND
jgi:hypothetical protein